MSNLHEVSSHKAFSWAQDWSPSNPLWHWLHWEQKLSLLQLQSEQSYWQSPSFWCWDSTPARMCGIFGNPVPCTGFPTPGAFQCCHGGTIEDDKPKFETWLGKPTSSIITNRNLTGKKKETWSGSHGSHEILSLSLKSVLTMGLCNKSRTSPNSKVHSFLERHCIIPTIAKSRSHANPQDNTTSFLASWPSCHSLPFASCSGFPSSCNRSMVRFNCSRTFSADFMDLSIKVHYRPVDPSTRPDPMRCTVAPRIDVAVIAELRRISALSRVLLVPWRKRSCEV